MEKWKMENSRSENQKKRDSRSMLHNTSEIREYKTATQKGPLSKYPPVSAKYIYLNQPWSCRSGTASIPNLITILTKLQGC